jgi:hypothetical protein
MRARGKSSGVNAIIANNHKGETHVENESDDPSVQK